MGRLTHLSGWQPWGERAQWQLRACGRWLMRVVGWRTLALVVLALMLWGLLRHQTQRLAGVQQALASPSAARRPALPHPSTNDTRHERLRRFEAQLLQAEQLPSTLEALMQEAHNEGITVQRGEYRAQWDAPGRFTRYQMSWPVKGAAPAVGRFVQAALLAHPNLALERIQFKRDNAEQGEIEARLQWSLLMQEASVPPQTQP
jgi:hypothetical protein